MADTRSKRRIARRRGADTEQGALDRLQAAGLLLLARNFSCRSGEIDLVMRDGTTLVFVEVRYRARADFGGALESVSITKQKRLRLAAQHYLQTTRLPGNTVCRFDVVTAEGTPGAVRWHWYRSAFD